MKKYEVIHKSNNNIKTNETKFKENFYSMLGGNTCVAEPNLEELLA